MEQTNQVLQAALQAALGDGYKVLSVEVHETAPGSDAWGLWGFVAYGNRTLYCATIVPRSDMVEAWAADAAKQLKTAFDPS